MYLLILIDKSRENYCNAYFTYKVIIKVNQDEN